MKRSVKNAEHYVWGGSCDGWHLLKSDRLSVIQERMPPHTSEKLHFHRSSQQLFYVLSGVATFEIEGRTVEVGPKESVHIPNGVQHRIMNAGDQDLEFLVISEPASHGDRIDASSTSAI